MVKLIEHQNCVELIYEEKIDDLQSFQEYIRNSTNITKKNFEINILSAPPLSEPFLKRLSFTAKVLKTAGRTITFIVTIEQKEVMCKGDHADLFKFEHPKVKRQFSQIAGGFPKSESPSKIEVKENLLSIGSAPEHELMEKLLDNLEGVYKTDGAILDISSMDKFPYHVLSILNLYYIESKINDTPFTLRISPKQQEEISKKEIAVFPPIQSSEQPKKARETTTTISRFQNKDFSIKDNCLYIGRVTVDHALEKFNEYFEKLICLKVPQISMDITEMPKITSPLARHFSMSALTAKAMGYDFKIIINSDQKDFFSSSSQIVSPNVEIKDAKQSSSFIDYTYGSKRGVETTRLDSSDAIKKKALAANLSQFGGERISGYKPGEGTKKIVSEKLQSESPTYSQGEHISLENASVSFRNLGWDPPKEINEFPLIDLGREGASFYSDALLSPGVQILLTISTPLLPVPLEIESEILHQSVIPGKTHYILEAKFLKITEKNKACLDFLFNARS